MRILMITDFYWPFVGGVEQHVRSLSAELANRGHEVTVATLWQAELAAAEWDGAVRVCRIRSTMQRAPWLFRHPQRPWAPPMPDPEVVGALRRLVQEIQPHIVHGHDWLARSFIPLKRASGAKFVMSLHYYTLACAKKNLMYNEEPCRGPEISKCIRCAAAHYGAAKGMSVALTNWYMRQRELRTVDMFLPVSQVTADQNGLPNSGVPFRVIPNFLPPSTSAQAEDLGDYLAQLPTPPFFMFVGDLRRQKGLDVLLTAYAQLGRAGVHNPGSGRAGSDNVPPLVLIGKVWDETPKEFPPGVIILERWPNYAVIAAWQRALAAIVPSIWSEPFGIVVIEAMSRACPVIAAEIGGIPDMVRDGATGLLVPPNDPDQLRHAMARLLADPALATRLGEAAQHRAADFRAEEIVPRIEQVYAELLETPLS